MSHQAMIDRLRADIAKARGDDAALMKREASLSAKATQASAAAARTSSLSSMAARLKEQDRALKELASITKKRADIGKRIAAKEKELARYAARQASDDERTRKRIEREQESVLRRHNARAQELTRALRIVAEDQASVADGPYDFFISHASADKDDFVRPLANELIRLGAKVFYDETTLRVGDSLRRSIDAGLRSSRFGVVVLSTEFFRSAWPGRELGGLTAMEVAGMTRILPIWHKVTKDEVRGYSPTLADKVALNTSVNSAAEIAAKLFELLPPAPADEASEGDGEASTVEDSA